MPASEPTPCFIPLHELAHPCPFPAVMVSAHSTAHTGERVVAVDIEEHAVRLSARVGRAHWTVPCNTIAVDVSHPGGQQLVGRWLGWVVWPEAPHAHGGPMWQTYKYALLGKANSEMLCALVACVLAHPARPLIEHDAAAVNLLDFGSGPQGGQGGDDGQG